MPQGDARPGPARTERALRTLAVRGRTIVVQDVGLGPPVILAHCSSASHREWDPVTATLRTRYRVLAPDLVGYGRSDRWRRNEALEPADEVEPIERLADLAGGGPVHLAGHSYGAAILLEAALALGPRVASLTLIEPVAFHLLALSGKTIESEEVLGVARRVQDALSRGSATRAARIYMSFWIGRIAWWLMPARRRRGIVATVDKVAAEFAMMQRLATTPAQYARIEAPVRLIVGGRSPRAARAVSQTLLDHLPNAHERILPRAGHMSPFTHPDLVRDLIVEHVDATQAGSARAGGQAFARSA